MASSCLNSKRCIKPPAWRSSRNSEEEPCARSLDAHCHETSCPTVAHGHAHCHFPDPTKPSTAQLGKTLVAVATTAIQLVTTPSIALAAPIHSSFAMHWLPCPSRFPFMLIFPKAPASQAAQPSPVASNSCRTATSPLLPPPFPHRQKGHCAHRHAAEGAPPPGAGESSVKSSRHSSPHKPDQMRTPLAFHTPLTPHGRNIIVSMEPLLP